MALQRTMDNYQYGGGITNFNLTQQQLMQYNSQVDNNKKGLINNLAGLMQSKGFQGAAIASFVAIATVRFFEKLFTSF